MVPVMDVKSVLTGRRGVSLPFTDFCEPIIYDDLRPQDVLRHITTCGRDRGWKYIEFRGGKELLHDAQPSTVFCGHTLSLSCDEGKVFSNLKDGTRRNVRKAIKEGVEVETVRSLAAVKDFYKLNCMTRKQHGLPPQPYYFFKKVHEHIISEGLGFVALARCNDTAIAGNMYFHFGEKAVYKYGASDKAYQNLRASNLVMWEAIRWYCQNGFKELHFGRTELHHQGLRQFKAGWGAREDLIGYFKYDLSKSSYISTEVGRLRPFHTRIFSKTPISLLKDLWRRFLWAHGMTTICLEFRSAVGLRGTCISEKNRAKHSRR